MLDTWVRTVRSLMCSSAAISLFACPAPTSTRTSRSRAVISAPGSLGGPAFSESISRRAELQRPAVGRADRCRHLVGIGVLEQVARRARLQRRVDALGLAERGQRDDLDVAVLRADAARRL